MQDDNLKYLRNTIGIVQAFFRYGGNCCARYANIFIIFSRRIYRKNLFKGS